MLAHLLLYFSLTCCKDRCWSVCRKYACQAAGYEKLWDGWCAPSTHAMNFCWEVSWSLIGNYNFFSIIFLSVKYTWTSFLIPAYASIEELLKDSENSSQRNCDEPAQRLLPVRRHWKGTFRRRNKKKKKKKTNWLVCEIKKATAWQLYSC
jgi:hypothetical protein